MSEWGQGGCPEKVTFQQSLEGEGMWSVLRRGDSKCQGQGTAGWGDIGGRGWGGLPGGPSRRLGEGWASVWGFELSPWAAAGSWPLPGLVWGALTDNTPPQQLLCPAGLRGLLHLPPDLLSVALGRFFHGLLPPETLPCLPPAQHPLYLPGGSSTEGGLQLGP